MGTNNNPKTWTSAMAQHHRKMEELAKRRMAEWKALPEPRVQWEEFKRTWKDNQ